MLEREQRRVHAVNAGSDDIVIGIRVVRRSDTRWFWLVQLDSVLESRGQKPTPGSMKFRFNSGRICSAIDSDS